MCNRSSSTTTTPHMLCVFCSHSQILVVLYCIECSCFVSDAVVLLYMCQIQLYHIILKTAALYQMLLYSIDYTMLFVCLSIKSSCSFFQHRWTKSRGGVPDFSIVAH